MHLSRIYRCFLERPSDFCGVGQPPSRRRSQSAVGGPCHVVVTLLNGHLHVNEALGPERADHSTGCVGAVAVEGHLDHVGKVLDWLAANLLSPIRDVPGIREHER